MRHGPQRRNAKHRHQSRAHGSDHRITHAPSQRPRLMHLPCSVHHGSSLRPALTMDPSSQRRAYAAIDLTYAQLSFLKGWVWLRGLNALSNACIAALNYNVLHHMCSTLGAPSWRTRIERTSHELHSQDSQNPCSHLLCFGHRQPRHRRRRYRHGRSRFHVGVACDGERV